MTEQVQRYFEPSESSQVNLWNGPNQGEQQASSLPGREVDVTVARHSVKDNSIDGSIEFDASIGILPLFFPIPIPFASGWPSVSKNDSEFYTHTTSKVIRYPAIAKSVQTYKDGIYHLEENLAFDQYSGKPMAVRSQDEFSGRHDATTAFSSGYLKEDVATAWVYPEKRGKSENEGIRLRIGTAGSTPTTPIASGSSSSGLYFLAPTAAAIAAKCDILRFVHKGDLLMLNADPNQLYSAKSVGYNQNKVSLFPLTSATVTLPTDITQIEILASGNTNELGMTVGTTTYHKDNVGSGGNTSINLRTNGTKFLPNTATGTFAHDFTVAMQGASFSSAGSSLLHGKQLGRVHCN